MCEQTLHSYFCLYHPQKRNNVSHQSFEWCFSTTTHYYIVHSGPLGCGMIGGYLYTGYQRLSAVFMDVEGADWGQEQEKKIKYILPFLKDNQQKKITHWPHEYKTPNLKQIRAVTRVWELTSRSPPNQTEIKAACAEKIYNNPKQFSDRRHKTKAALTEQRLLEHCSSSFPETDLSQATQAAAPEGDTGTNWCPLAAPGFSFPSFTSFTFTWKASRKHFQKWLRKLLLMSWKGAMVPTSKRFGNHLTLILQVGTPRKLSL